MGAYYEHLSYVDRLSIDEGRRAGLSLRAIARKLKRAPSTVSRDIKRMGRIWPHYDASSAFFSALTRRRVCRSGTRKLRLGSPLFASVANQIRQGWSPLQIAGRMRAMNETTNPNLETLGTVSHETIYTALYALPRPREYGRTAARTA